METGIYSGIVRALAAGLPGVMPGRIRMPARGYAAGLYGPEIPCPAPEDFPLLYGAPLVERAERRGDWLYFILTDAFYDALAAHACALLPQPDTDGGSAAINRLLALSRQGGTGCPRWPSVQRALLCAACAEASPAAYRAAVEAAQHMLPPLPPAAKEAVRQRCGQAADASARLLFAAGGDA